MEKLIDKIISDREIANRPKDNIPGWGIDIDTENDPTYSMKFRTGDDYNRLNYERAEQQPETVEILHSNERPNLTAVFGTTVPPKGLSGMIRRYAFKHSEGSSKHWFSLILADRINLVEGMLEDFSKGRVPNIFAERGWKAEWKHNKKGLLTKVAVNLAVAGVIVGLFAMRKKKKKSIL